MDELIRQVVIILRGLWQRRWIGLGVAWLVGVVGVAVVWHIPDQYEAAARVYVDTQTLLNPLMTGLAVQPNIEQQMQQMAMLTRTLLRRPNLEKLAQRAGLDDGRKSKDAVVDDLARRLQVQGTPRENLYTLSYRDGNRARAMRVIESLLAIFLESTKNAGQRGSDEAKSFIEGQIKIYEQKLEEAENRLKEFKVRHLGMAEGGQGYFAMVEELRGQLQEARLALRQAENSRDSLRRQISGEQPVLAESEAKASATETHIAALKRDLDGLLQRFTDQHPDVVGTRRVIAQLEAQRRQELKARENGGPASPTTATNANPVYQELKISLAKEEANVASLRVRVAEYESRYTQLKEAGRLAPQIEAELAQLNRDYDINKKNYETLVSRREQAQISSELDAAGVADFRVIDPPRASPGPVAPNRVVLMLMLLIAAPFAGLAASFASTKIWPTFSDIRSLREVTGLPVLGAVSFLWTDEARKVARRDLIRFFSAFTGLLALVGTASVLLVVLSARTG